MTWQSQIGFPILSVITFLPLLGVIAMLLVGRGKPQVYKVIALIVTLAAFVLAILMLVKFDTHAHGMQFVENVMWIKALNIHYGFGIDGIAALLLFLTTFLGVIVIIRRCSRCGTPSGRPSGRSSRPTTSTTRRLGRSIRAPRST